MMHMLFRLACAMAFLFAPTLLAQTTPSVQAPAGFAPMQAPCVVKTGGGCAAVSPAVPMPVTPLESLPVYVATATGYGAYATPTDMLTITAPTGKRLTIRDMRMIANVTTGVLANFQYLTRATANSGGTSTTLSAVKRNTADTASSAVVRLYTAAPTTGTLDRSLGEVRVMISAATSTPTLIATSNTGSSIAGLFGGVPIAGIVLNPGETLVLGFGGAALPAGFTASVGVVWTEETL
ncbi:hypothetical protein [Sphingobium cupriresistens]|uniref:DUF4402 domain-containing protein n=1 Tax=Sphingobium cupriresistens TaxID=1132417 RepID=A0A8G1ZF92_9SPHN|nr:hypothetical protein [Sphingobium cupriresistens]RYM07987.1 hypothetical protein EWH12_17790 [Sphingobium cupriresistens]